jgi:HK97 family phage major capsid protein
MDITYIVTKQFALADTIYNVGDTIEMKDSEAKGLLNDGKIELDTKEEKTISLELDESKITSAITKGFNLLVPSKKSVEPKLSYGEFLQSIANKSIDEHIINKTINIGTDAQGGYTTTEFNDPDIDVDILKQSGIAQMANNITLTGNNNLYKFNVVSSMGTTPAITVEGVAIAASQPIVTQFEIDLAKTTYRFDVTEEALMDTGALVGEINSQVPEEFAKFIENGMINGTTNFTGIVGDTNTVTVAKESGQTDDTIVAENIDKMFSAGKNVNKMKWIMSRTAYSGIQGLEDSNGNRLFQGPNQLGPAPFGTLKGLPIMISDYSQAIGTVGDILLCDLSKYRIASKGGLRMASSAHVKFLEDETVFKFTYRLGGIPIGIKLTALDLSEIGDFVELSSRGS